MKDGQIEHDNPSLSLGVALIALSAMTLWYSRGITELGLGGNSDPGPKFFPIALSIALIIGGIYEIAKWTKKIKRSDFNAREATIRINASFGKTGSINFAALVISFLIYLPLITWVGFTTATLLFCTLWTKRLGSSALVSIGFAIFMIILIQSLFAGLFHVQLPEGALTWLSIDHFMVNKL